MKRYYKDAFGNDVLSSQIVSLNGNMVILENSQRHTMDSDVADEIAFAIKSEMAAHGRLSPNTIRPLMDSPIAIWPAPMRAESVAGFWLTGDASWWSVMDDFGTCVEVEVRTFNGWLLSGEVAQ